MKRSQLISSIAAVLLALPFSGAAAEPAKSALEADPEGWTDIMPGADLNGWYRVSVPPGRQLGREQWHVDAGEKMLICDGDGGHDMLMTKKEYGDAVFHLEFRYTKVEGKKGYNSGAYVRNSEDGSVWHQAQFGDAKDGYLFGATMGEDGRRMGFKGPATENRVKPAGEWNTMEIAARGRAIALWINGAVTAEYKECGAPKGRVGVEAEGYRIEFRNLKIKELK